jgi:hypothetical protein
MTASVLRIEVVQGIHTMANTKTIDTAVVVITKVSLTASPHSPTQTHHIINKAAK